MSIVALTPRARGNGGVGLSWACLHLLLLLVGTWEERWVQSKHKDDYGSFVRTAGAFYGDAELDKGEPPKAFLCIKRL